MESSDVSRPTDTHFTPPRGNATPFSAYSRSDQENTLYIYANDIFPSSDSFYDSGHLNRTQSAAHGTAPAFTFQCLLVEELWERLQIGRYTSSSLGMAGESDSLQRNLGEVLISWRRQEQKSGVGRAQHTHMAKGPGTPCL